MKFEFIAFKGWCAVRTLRNPCPATPKRSRPGDRSYRNRSPAARRTVSCTVNFVVEGAVGRFFAAGCPPQALGGCRCSAVYALLPRAANLRHSHPDLRQGTTATPAAPAVRVSRCRECRKPPSVLTRPMTLPTRSTRGSPWRPDIRGTDAVLSWNQGKAPSKFCEKNFARSGRPSMATIMSIRWQARMNMMPPSRSPRESHRSHGGGVRASGRNASAN